jgi:hypothetical protein
MLKIAGGGEPERPIIPLPSRDSNVVPNAWTRDQQHLITTILNGQDPARLFINKIGDAKPTRLLATNRNAMTVYGSLLWIAEERRQLNTTRRAISKVCGLHEETITQAMTALNESGWVTVNYGRQGAKTWYRLSFPVPSFFPVPGKNPHREGSKSRKKPPQGTVPCTHKKPPQSLKRLGTVAALTGDPVPIEEKTESRAARIERERMAQIQEASTWAEVP